MRGQTVAQLAALTLTLLALVDLLGLLRTAAGSGSCLLDDEGSWSIGLFKGSSPLNVTPIERVHPRVDGPAAWPVANPILTCATVTNPPSNFVADPFLWRVAGGNWYLFFETKTNSNQEGDIGVAESSDGGASWQYLGLALNEPWHLSYPFVFEYKGQVYLLPEGCASGALRLYRAVDFPLQWEFDRVLVDRPLIDTSLVEWEGRWWMFTSDTKRRGTTKNGELEIFYADTPLGPWQPHALNPVMNGDRRAGARMGGRIVPFEGKLLRFGQDCGATYGHQVVAYRIDVLTPSIFQQTRVPLEFGQSRQGPAAWNGMRAHHVDAQQLEDGSWLAVMDGDWQPSGPISMRLKRAAALLGALGAAVLGTACATRLRHCSSPPLPLQCAVSSSPSVHWLRQTWPALEKACAAVPLRVRHALEGTPLARAVGGPGNSGRRSRPCSHSPRPLSFRRGSTNPGCPGLGTMYVAGKSALGRWGAVESRLRLQPGSWGSLLTRAAVLTLLLLAAAGLVAGAAGAWYYLSIVWDEPRAAEAVAVGGQLSQFTLVVMTYAARLPTLRLFVQHYSRCPSVAEILVVWNSGPPPEVSRDLPASLMPIRVRVESENSLNNRFRPDPLIRTRAVLQLDDDTLLWCSDVERGFAAWRSQPQALVGFFPRLITTVPAPAYLGDGEVFGRGFFNAVLTKGAFLDAEQAFPLYWGPANAAGRSFVDRHFNCEDILMNFLLASNQSASYREAAIASGTADAAGVGRRVPGHETELPPTVVYVHPRRRLDISGLSGVGISRSAAHANKRVACVEEFAQLFGGNPLRRVRVGGWAQAGSPLLCLPLLGCIFV